MSDIQETANPPEKKAIILNGKEISEEEFVEEKKRLTEKKINLVSVGENQWKTRLID
jgi:hypothetical protein